MIARPGIRHGDLYQDKNEQRITVRVADGEDDVLPRFGKMFSKLAAFVPPNAYPDEPEPFVELAFLMAGEDQLEDPSADSKIPAGYTVLGQFITHDLTFNNLPLDGQPDDPNTVNNYRTPRFDLDSVYGRSLQLGIPAPRDGMKMRYRKSTHPSEPDDLPRYVDVKQADDFTRYADEQALIGDLRNDENVLISQLHLVFLKLHNRFVDDIDQGRIRPDEVPGDTAFEKAMRLCQWYYQWIVVNDYLRRIVGWQLVNSILRFDNDSRAHFDIRFYRQGQITPPTIPFEFSVAAFRFGHSMVRSHYHINDGGPLPLFGYSSGDTRHLGGRRRLDIALVVDWSRFFECLPRPVGLAGDRPFTQNFSRKIDSHLTRLFRRLPDDTLAQGPGFDVKSLALRDLKRGVEQGLPSGQAMAAEMEKTLVETLGRYEPLSTEALGVQSLGFNRDVPLWFYILKEAEVTKNEDGLCGEQLGPVGGRIVSEVLLGLLKCDEESYLNTVPWFDPAVPHGCNRGPLWVEGKNPNGLLNGKTFTMSDLLQLAGLRTERGNVVAVDVHDP